MSRDGDPDSTSDDPDDADSGERDLAEREAAGEFAADVPTDALIELADDDNPLVRARGLDAIYSRAPRAALPHLLRALGDDDGRVGDRAVEILGRLRDPASMTLVGESLTRGIDTAGRIRALMVLALRAGEPASAAYVDAVLKDDNQIIREAAIQFQTEFVRRRELQDARDTR